MTSINVSLPEPMRDWIEAKIKAGRYGNLSEYVRDLIRRDQEREAQERLEAMLLEGLASGNGAEIPPEFWEKKRQQLMKGLTDRTTKPKKPA